MFDSSGYPFAIKIATGKINAVTGDAWKPGLSRKPQDYVVSPDQPWLDGYCVEKGTIRQFVAMPLGAGYTAEEQLTGEAEHGGLQMLVYPMKAEAYEKMLARRAARDRRMTSHAGTGRSCLRQCRIRHGPRPRRPDAPGDLRRSPRARRLGHRAREPLLRPHRQLAGLAVDHGRARRPRRPPPPSSTRARACPGSTTTTRARPAVDGSAKLADLQSVKEYGEAKGDVPLPENESVTPENVVRLRAQLAKDQVREGAF